MDGWLRSEKGERMCTGKMDGGIGGGIGVRVGDVMGCLAMLTFNDIADDYNNQLRLANSSHG